MTDSPIRYGVIGCGSMGREHMLNLHAMGGAVVTAIADPHEPSRATATALCYGHGRRGRFDPQGKLNTATPTACRLLTDLGPQVV